MEPEAWHFPVPVYQQEPGEAQQHLALIVQPKKIKRNIADSISRSKKQNEKSEKLSTEQFPASATRYTRSFLKTWLCV